MHQPFAVFRHREREGLCAVVANYETQRAIAVEVKLDNGQAPTHYRLVGESGWHRVEGAVSMPPRSAAVFVSWEPNFQY